MKTRKKTPPMRFDEAVAKGLITVVTDPNEIRRLVEKERHEMGYRNHVDKSKDRSDNELAYSDCRYTVDSAYKDLF